MSLVSGVPAYLRPCWWPSLSVQPPHLSNVYPIANYLNAAGAEHTRVILTFDGHDIELDLDLDTITGT